MSKDVAFKKVLIGMEDGCAIIKGGDSGAFDTFNFAGVASANDALEVCIDDIKPLDECNTTHEIEEAFVRWWNEEGSGMPPHSEEDHSEHVRRMCRLAWHNGEYIRSGL